MIPVHLLLQPQVEITGKHYWGKWQAGRYSEWDWAALNKGR